MFRIAARFMQRALQRRMISEYGRRVPIGDLVTDRWENAKEMGFGDLTSMYDSALVIGDVKVGRDTWIGPNVILDGSGSLTIGDKCSISAGVHIYTHDTVQWAITRGGTGAQHSPTRIGNGVYIGPYSVIARGVTVGDGVVIGAMSFVNADVPSGARVWGRPARVQSMSKTSEMPMAAMVCPIGYDPGVHDIGNEPSIGFENVNPDPLTSPAHMARPLGAELE